MQQDMLYIYEVYREGSFSKAAQKLYVSQPTLSISIKKIEEHLGISLFERGSNPLRLTEAGSIYIEKIKKIMNIEEDLYSEINDLSKLKTGHIRIGGTQYFNSYILPLALQKFNLLYPGITIELKEDNSAKISDLLLESSIDLMFSCNEINDNEFTIKKVFRDELILGVPYSFSINKHLSEFALSKEMIVNDFYLSDNCPCVPIEKFKDIAFLLLTQENNLYHRAISICNNAGFSPIIKMHLDQLVTAFNLSCAGLGATFVSTLSVKNNLNSNNLIYYKISSPLTTRYFNVITKKDKYVSNIVKKFIDIIVNLYENTPNSGV